ncbi:MAG TPA: hypothetical protein VK903_03080, partial [Propionicimonas sp.]|nr:hypothetical protein [Propionicimonas sp.]
MSYDLAVWVGERPRDDVAAAAEYEARFDASETSEQPPGPQIAAFVAALLERFPEGSDDGVWSVEPVLDEGAGDFLCLTMAVSEQLDDVVDHASHLAHEHGLVVYDPQRECLAVDRPADDEAESWWDWELPAVALAHVPDRIDHAMAVEVLEMSRRRLDTLIDTLGSGPQVEMPLLITILLMRDHEDMALPVSVWRSVLSLLGSWWAAGPDVVQGREWLSTDGGRALIFAWPEEPGPDWQPICGWYLTSITN